PARVLRPERRRGAVARADTPRGARIRRHPDRARGPAGAAAAGEAGVERVDRRGPRLRLSAGAAPAGSVSRDTPSRPWEALSAWSSAGGRRALDWRDLVIGRVVPASAF